MFYYQAVINCCVYVNGVFLCMCSISISSWPVLMDGKSLCYSDAQRNTW